MKRESIQSENRRRHTRTNNPAFAQDLDPSSSIFLEVQRHFPVCQQQPFKFYFSERPLRVTFAVLPIGLQQVPLGRTGLPLSVIRPQLEKEEKYLHCRRRARTSLCQSQTHSIWVFHRNGTFARSLARSTRVRETPADLEPHPHVHARCFLFTSQSVLLSSFQHRK